MGAFCETVVCLTVWYVHCVAVEETRPLCHRATDNDHLTAHCPAAAAAAAAGGGGGDDDVECRVGLLQRCARAS